MASENDKQDEDIPTISPDASGQDEQSPEPPEEPDDPKKTLTLYRALVIVLLVGLVAVWLFFDHLNNKLLDRVGGLERQISGVQELPGGGTPRGQPSGSVPGVDPPLDIVDLVAQYDTIIKKQPDRSDISQTFFGTANATVLLHLVAPGQLTPLHIHRKPDEFAVILKGSAAVTHRYGVAGKAATRSSTYSPGFLVGTPASCGSEWFNASNEAYEANLVFMSSPSDGNLYVKPEDARLLRGADPFVWDPVADFDKMAAEAAPFQRKPLPFFGGRMTLAFVKTEGRIEKAKDRPGFLYVLKGSATLDDTNAVREGFLAMFQGATPITVKAQGGPVALLVFDPENVPAAAVAPGPAPAPSAAATP